MINCFLEFWLLLNSKELVHCSIFPIQINSGLFRLDFNIYQSHLLQKSAINSLTNWFKYFKETILVQNLLKPNTDQD